MGAWLPLGGGGGGCPLQMADGSAADQMGTQEKQKFQQTQIPTNCRSRRRGVDQAAGAGSPAGLAARPQVCQDCFGRQPPRLEGAVQGGRVAVVAAGVEAAAQPDGAGEVGGRGLEGGVGWGGGWVTGGVERGWWRLRRMHSRWSQQVTADRTATPPPPRLVHPPTHLVRLGKGDAVGAQVAPCVHLLPPKPLRQLGTKPGLQLSVRQLWVGADGGSRHQGLQGRVVVGTGRGGGGWAGRGRLGSRESD